MLTIKKGSMVITREKNDIQAASDTADGIYLKFRDNTEIIFNIPVTPMIRALVGRLEQMTAKNIELDLNDPNNIIKISD